MHTYLGARATVHDLSPSSDLESLSTILGR